VWRFGSFNAVVLFPNSDSFLGASGGSLESWVPIFSASHALKFSPIPLGFYFPAVRLPAFYFLGFGFSNKLSTVLLA